MAAEKEGITVKIDAELHAEVWQFLDSHDNFGIPSTGGAFSKN